MDNSEIYLRKSIKFERKKPSMPQAKRQNNLGRKESDWYFHNNIQRKAAKKFLKKTQGLSKYTNFKKNTPGKEKKKFESRFYIHLSFKYQSYKYQY